MVVQYFDWLSAAARGDLGKSLVLNDSVTTLLSDRIVVTLQLGMYALGFALLVAVPLSSSLRGSPAIARTGVSDWSERWVSQYPASGWLSC